jgi:hypothetical protein
MWHYIPQNSNLNIHCTGDLNACKQFLLEVILLDSHFIGFGEDTLSVEGNYLFRSFIFMFSLLIMACILFVKETA